MDERNKLAQVEADFSNDDYCTDETGGHWTAEDHDISSDDVKSVDTTLRKIQSVQTQRGPGIDTQVDFHLDETFYELPCMFHKQSYFLWVYSADL